MQSLAVLVWEKHFWKVAGLKIFRPCLCGPCVCLPSSVDHCCFRIEKAHTAAFCVRSQARACAEICRVAGFCWHLKVRAYVPNTSRWRRLNSRRQMVGKCPPAPQSAPWVMLMSSEQFLGCGGVRASESVCVRCPTGSGSCTWTRGR